MPVKPVDLLRPEVDGESLALELGVLGVGPQLGSNVNDELARFHGERAIVEEPMDISPQHEAAVRAVLAELRVTIEVARL
jgi:hypothetical protein